MTAISVHVKETAFISPSEPTPNHILQLSDLDAQFETVLYLLVYNPCPGGLDRVAITNNVKSSLGRALVHYYPLAGRVRNRADGRASEVLCQAQGALFVDAVSDCTVSVFGKAPEHEEKWREFLPVTELNVLKGAPPLAVQLTWLSDGGATLVVGFNHCVCDGIGSSEFLNLFTELALGRLAELEDHVPKPTWSRHLMNMPPSFVQITHANSSVMHRHPELTIIPGTAGSTHRYAKERLTPTSATFDLNKLNELKKLVVGFKCTSFEVLSAHVWRSWARALKLPSDQMVKLVFSVNVRNRVKPRLPNGYYGNAYVLVCAQTCVKDLIEKDLGYATELVMRAKERVDKEYVQEVVGLVSTGDTIIDMVGTLIITQWSRLGLDLVDFGMGRPAQIWPVRWDITILLPVSNLTNAVNVHMGVPSDAVDQYLYLLGCG